MTPFSTRFKISQQKKANGYFLTDQTKWHFLYTHSHLVTQSPFTSNFKSTAPLQAEIKMRTFALFLLKTDNAKRQLPRYVLSPVTINAPEERFRNNCGEVDEVVHEYASKFTSYSASTSLNVLMIL